MYSIFWNINKYVYSIHHDAYTFKNDSSSISQVDNTSKEAFLIVQTEENSLSCETNVTEQVINEQLHNDSLKKMEKSSNEKNSNVVNERKIDFSHPPEFFFPPINIQIEDIISEVHMDHVFNCLPVEIQE